MSGLDGWLVVDKPAGLTSAQVVGRLRRALCAGGHGRVRIGHGGTLDPLATGVLPVAIGEATKLAGRLLAGDKAYDFDLAFGTATETDDAEGRITGSSAVRPSEAEIREILPRFTGPIRQRPPAFSALKVDGRRAHALARAGRAVRLAERDVIIHALSLRAFDGATARLSVRCSKGTYVRALARDIAAALGTLGHVAALRRTAAGPFTLAHAMPLDKCLELVHGPGAGQALLPLAAGLDDIPVLPVDAGQALALRRGQRLPGLRSDPGLYLATHGPVPVALVRVSAGEAVVERGFNLD